MALCILNSVWCLALTILVSQNSELIDKIIRYINRIM